MAGRGLFLILHQLRREKTAAGERSGGGVEMTIEDFVGILDGTGIPFAYDHFAEGGKPGAAVYLLPAAGQ